MEVLSFYPFINTEGTPPGPNDDRPKGSESAKNPSVDERYAKEVDGRVDTYYARLKRLDELRGRDRTGDFILYKRAETGQFAIKGILEENMLLVDIVQDPNTGAITRQLSVRRDFSDSGLSIKVKVSGDVSRGFEYVVDKHGEGKITQLFDKTVAISAEDQVLPGGYKEKALGNIADDLTAFGVAISVEEAIAQSSEPSQ